MFLPEELLVEIAEYVVDFSERRGTFDWDEDQFDWSSDEPEDSGHFEHMPPEQPILKLRLVCRVWARITTPILAQAWFSDLTVLLHRPCLNNLLEISNHEVFRHAVQSLTIGVNSLRPEPMVPKEWRLWAFNVTGYIRAWEDQQHIMASGLNTHYLSEVCQTSPI